jgi:hypothetical protein
MESMMREGPPNWLSKIIEEKRRKIERVIPLIERRAERDAIVESIKKHPNGQPLAASPDLADIVWAALGIANQCDCDAVANPDSMTASAAVQASWFIFRELELQLPPAE